MRKRHHPLENSHKVIYRTVDLTTHACFCVVQMTEPEAQISTRRLDFILRVLVTLGLSVFAALVLVIACLRVTFAEELEWMGGAMLDHIERVRLGLPLYAAPSARWAAFIYPPGYYWVAAALSRVMPEIIAARGLSVVASLLTAAAGYAMARRCGASKYFAALAPLLFVGSYHYLSDWFDLERVDMLFVAVIAWASVLLRPSGPMWRIALAGVMVGGAFFVKQPAVLFLGCITVALATLASLRAAAAFGGAGFLTLGLGYVALQHTTSGWFKFYCLTLPASHGIEAKFLTLFFVSDVGRAPVFAIATVVICASVVSAAVKKLRGQPQTESVDFLIFGAFLGAGLLAAASSRMHLGGWPNVLSFWVTFAAPGVSIVLHRACTDLNQTAARIALALPLLQGASYAPDPGDLIPSSTQLRQAQSDNARLRTLENEGEVLVLGRGHVTKSRHLHVNALVDILRAKVPPPEDFLTGVRQRHYRAIVINGLGDIDLSAFYGSDPGIFDLVTRHYYVGERLDGDQGLPVTGFATAPRIALFPRQQVLSQMPRSELERRQQIELGVADMDLRIRKGRGNVPMETVEQRAEGLLPH